MENARPTPKSKTSADDKRDYAVPAAGSQARAVLEHFVKYRIAITSHYWERRTGSQRLAAHIHILRKKYRISILNVGMPDYLRAGRRRRVGLYHPAPGELARIEALLKGER